MYSLLKTFSHILLLIGVIALSPLFSFASENSEKNNVASKQHLHTSAHAHNDYEHERPLLDALENKFYSVEADIWMVDGDILVSHNKGRYKGSLKELYLEPLQKRVKEYGSVHNDGETFYLWLDIKDGRDELRPILHVMLSQYPMLSTFTDKKIQAGPVTAILTGNAKSKQSYVKEYHLRFACRDSNDYNPDDPPADHRWRWYALHWSSYITWNGNGDMPQEHYNKLTNIVNDIHKKGRKVRFYATPESPLYWKLALETGVDLINTDLLRDLNSFLCSYASKKD